MTHFVKQKKSFMYQNFKTRNSKRDSLILQAEACTIKLTRVKHLSGTPLYGRLLASPTNNKLGWYGLPGTNTLAYYENP